MKRLTEASTWAGFAAIFQALKIIVPPQYHVLLDGATALAGTVAAGVPEKTAK